MPPRSPTTVGMAVETTVISMAAIDKLSSRATTVSGRLVFIAVCTMLLRAGRLVVQWQLGGNAAAPPCRTRSASVSSVMACGLPPPFGGARRRFPAPRRLRAERGRERRQLRQRERRRGDPQGSEDCRSGPQLECLHDDHPSVSDGGVVL